VQISTANLLPALDRTRTVTEASASNSDGVLSFTQRLAGGDEEAFREFHALYFDRLYQFLLVVARGQEHQAREALQETMLRVARYVRGFETEDAFWGWLKVVARSAARDAGRKQRRYLAMLQNFALHWRTQTTDAAEMEDTYLRELLTESLTALNAKDRRLIEGKYLEGASVKELAMIAGLTDKAVESRLLRARRVVREFIFTKLKTP
jgi:RNA polymerase sigma factor (sigma-70 family)